MKSRVLALVFLIVLALVAALTALQREGESPAGSAALQATSAESEVAREAPAADSHSAAKRPIAAVEPGPDIEPAQRFDERREARGLTLSGRLFTPSGESLRGAELSWTPLLPEATSPHALRGSRGRYESIKAATQHALSDETGHFEFERAPAELADLGSVVWITHAQWEAKGVRLAPRSQGLHWPKELALIPAPAFTVRVSDSRAHPAPRSTVRLFQERLLPGAGAQAPETLAREFLWREVETDAEGQALLPAVQGKAVLQAFKGELLSEWWSAEDRELVELTLRSGFSIEGKVTTGEGSPVPGQVLVNVGLYDDPGFGDFAWAGSSIIIAPDGTYGPVTLPLRPGGKLFGRAWGDRIQRAEIERSAPLPGEALRLDFVVIPAVAASVLVVDSAGQPIPEAKVLASVIDANGVLSQYPAEHPTDPDGLARVPGLRPGAVSLQASKDGYSRQTIGNLPPPAPQCLVPQPEEAGPFVVVLAAARRITGYVFHDGQPVPAFRLTYAQEAEAPADLDQLNEEGEFVLMARKDRALSLFASARGLPQSDVLKIPAGDEDVSDLELELPRPRVCRGQLVNRVTGAPIVEADIAVLTSMGTDFAGYRGDHYTPDDTGHFELPGLTPGRGGLAVFSPGYEDYFSLVHNNHGEVIEYGVLSLVPTAIVRLRVVAWPGPDFEGFSAWSSQSNLTAPRPLEADGTLLLEGVETTNCEFFLRCPDGSIITRSRVPSPRHSTEVRFEVQAGSATLEVAVHAEEGQAEFDGCTVTVSQHSASDEASVRQVPLPANGRLTLANLVAGPAVVTVLDQNLFTACLARVELRPGQQQNLRLEIGGPQRCVRVQNHDLEAVRDTLFHITLPGAEGGWHATLRSDARGEFSVGNMGSDDLRLTFVSDGRSLFAGLELQLEPDARRTTVVVCEETSFVSVRASELGEACEGVLLAYRHKDFPIFLRRLTFPTDQSGFAEGYSMPPGQISIVVENSAYWPARLDLEVVQNMRPVELELYSRATLRVIARTHDTLALAGVHFRLEHERLGSDLSGWIASGQVQATSEAPITGTDGSLVLQGLARGHYLWTARFPDGSEQNGELDLVPHGSLDLELRKD